MTQTLLPQTPERYLRSPRLVALQEGADLYVHAWEKRGERSLCVRVARTGEIGPEEVREPVTVDEPSADDHAESGGDRVVVEREAGRSRVWLERVGRRTLVWEAFGTATAPAIAPVADGVWVAFHHNVREDNGEPDIAKWIALRFVDSEDRVLEPRAPMADQDRDREGEEQSFEFPTIVVGADGALLIFGRGSHCFYVQLLSAAGWGNRMPLGESAWGCRGRRVAAARLTDGSVLTARRERAGIAIVSLPEPTGGRCELHAVDPIVQQKTHIAPVHRARITRDNRRILFGDIHQHSAHSDGIGAASEPYVRARHIYGDDFCALTDHESFLGKRIGPSEWSYLCAVANAHNDPGTFATLLAYEWTGRMHPGPGHKVVYLPAEGGPVVSRDDTPVGRDLVAAAEEMGAFAVPHHVGWTGADEGAHSVRGQPVWEICSCHGCYESFAHALGQRGDLRDQMVDAVLSRGHRFGFIASSDGHGLLWHHGVARKRDPFRTGLTAVHATACTREAILEALRERRCYATSGAKIELELRAGDAPMGSDLSGAGEVEVDALVLGEGDVDRVELVGRSGVLATGKGAGRSAHVRARIRDAYVYARVVQTDGEMAWSSPVFWD